MTKLIGNKLQPAEYIRNNWRVNAPVGVKYEELFVPSFWANVAIKFVRGDVIEVFAEDGSWYAEVIVRVSARTHAVVGELMFKDFNLKAVEGEPSEGVTKEGTKSEGSAPTIEWKGPKLKYAVIRHDGEYMNKGFETKQEAQDWVEANAETLV